MPARRAPFRPYLPGIRRGIRPDQTGAPVDQRPGGAPEPDPGRGHRAALPLPEHGRVKRTRARLFVGLQPRQTPQNPARADTPRIRVHPVAKRPRYLYPRPDPPRLGTVQPYTWGRKGERWWKSAQAAGDANCPARRTPAHPGNRRCSAPRNRPRRHQ